MAWYWPEVNTAENAKAARVNAITASFLVAVIYLSSTAKALKFIHYPWGSRLFLSSVITAVVFSVIGWGIHRMSRSASIVGLVLCCVSAAIHILGGYGFVTRPQIFWNVLDTLIVTCYVAAVRATFAYHRHNLAAIRAGD
jgi:hypothetical protein